MEARREQIVARVVEVLKSLPIFAGERVFRSLEDAIEREESPSAAVFFGGEDTEPMGSETDSHTMTLSVAYVVRGSPWDQLANAADVVGHQALAVDALQGPLSELLSDLRRQGAEPSAEGADQTAGALAVRYRIRYLTSRFDISRGP